MIGFMEQPQEKRDDIVERLAEINADPNAHSEKPDEAQASQAEQLDRETTKLLKELAENDPDNPSGDRKSKPR